MVSRETKKKLSSILHAVTQRIPGITLIFIILLGFLGPPFIPSVYWIVVLILHVFLCTNAVRLAFGLVFTAVKTKKYIMCDWKQRIEEFKAQEQITELPVQFDQIRHVIIIPNYKEEMETLLETLDVLASHELAKNTYKVILAMEQGEKGCEEKAEKIKALYAHRFANIYHTVHPSGIPGEARGKSSNEAWATTYYYKHLMKAGDQRYELFTVMDADSHLTQKYFECITYKYCTSFPEDQEKTMFAPTLVFDRNANHVPFVVRLADLCWSIGLMANFILPVKFPCSVYSVSMLLAEKVGFWDAGPEAMGEDIHMALKCWTKTRMSLKIHPIYIPASCSNVQADSYFKTIMARFEQSKRHLWGSLDFGYTVASLITRKCLTADPMRSVFVLYILFEIFFQPYFGLFHLFGQLIFPDSMLSPLGAWTIEYTTYIRLALIPPALVVAFAYERYHLICCEYRAELLKQLSEKKKAEGTSCEDALNGVVETEEGDIDVTVVSSGDQEVGFRKWYQIIDWAGLPFGLVAYYMIPGINAMICQLFTNRLDYKVSMKPTAKTSGQVAVMASAVVTDNSSRDSTGKNSPDVSIELQQVITANGSDQKLKVSEAKSTTDTATANVPSATAKLNLERGHSYRDSGVDIDDISVVA